MKHAFSLGLLMAALSGSAWAQTPPAAPQQPTNAAPAAPIAGGEKPKPDFMKRHMASMFKELDANGDGTITKEESNAFANKKFEDKDTNHDGKITQEEWGSFQAAKDKEWQEKREAFRKNHPEVMQGGRHDMKMGDMKGEHAPMPEEMKPAEAKH